VIERKINNYKGIFIVGSHIPGEVMKNLIEWARNGGILYVGAGTGIYDRFNNTSDIDSYLGVKREKFNFASEPGNDYYGLPGLKSLDSVKFTDDTITETVEVVCGFQKMKNVSPSETIAVFSDNSPAFAMKNSGKGKIVISGFFPGLAYMKSAVIANREKKQDVSMSDCPPEYPDRIRKIFEKIVAGIEKPVSVSDYLVEANLLETKDAYIVTLSNWKGTRVENLKIELNRHVQGKPVSTENQIISYETKNRQKLINLNMQSAFDFIVIPK
ncbi:MAG: hypothetical protein ACP5JO_08445, partial [Candidatus Ratteibacteria bacterium]